MQNTDRNINGLSIDAESLAIFGAMTKEAFIEFGKSRFYTEQPDAIRDKWLEELYNVATESQPKEAKKK